MVLRAVEAAVKAVLPAGATRLLSRVKRRIAGGDRGFEGLSTEDVFEKIYASGLWGRDARGNATSGSGSHDEALVAPYAAAVSALMSRLGCKTAVDLGCGDFNVGRRLVAQCDAYVACDISGSIIARNTAAFRHEGLSFRKLNIVEDALPTGDIAFVRQVFQHLGNAEIGRFVDKVNAERPFRRLLVTEHLPAGDFEPNRDKTTGAGIRVNAGSGVELHAAPFHLRHAGREVVLELDAPTGGVDARIRTTLYTF